MMPRPKIVAWLSVAGAEHRHLVEQRRPGRPSRLKKAVILRLVDHRQRNLAADAIDRQQKQRQKDLLTQFRDREDDANLFPHDSILP